MDANLPESDLSALLQRHADLEARYGDGDGGNFLSGWQCQNPLSGQIKALVQDQAENIDVGDYLYLGEESAVRQELLQFHARVDGVTPEALLCGNGSTSIIFTFCAWLRQKKISEIYYIPPLYFSLYFALQLLGIRARAVSGKQAFEPDFSVNLPSDKSVLLLSDPVWYTGVPVPREQINALIRWQDQTDSLIFIDGSFQYSNWTGRRIEFSANFSPQRTLRLICPTKALASHGYRFSYATLPRSMQQTCSLIYSSIYGSSSSENIAFARIVPSLMESGAITSQLMQLASEQHRRLRDRKKISAPWEPSCGYFVFEKISQDIQAEAPLMDGSYFEQKRYPDYRRINLLSPSMHLLD